MAEDLSMCMSFADLYELATGSEASDEVGEALGLMTQEERNAWVLRMAYEAKERKGQGVKTEERLGTDGVLYVAFWMDEQLPMSR